MFRKNISQNRINNIVYIYMKGSEDKRYSSVLDQLSGIDKVLGEITITRKCTDN